MIKLPRSVRKVVWLALWRAPERNNCRVLSKGMPAKRGQRACLGVPPKERERLQQKRVSSTPLISFVLQAGLAAALVSVPDLAQAIDHRPFDGILKRHVKKGRVDYEGLRRESKAALKKYLQAVAAARPASMSKKAQLAFYLNAYNALVLKSVLERSPVDKVNRVPGFFKRHKHRVAGKSVTLDHLEHKIIRPTFKDPRVHFGLVCAARSCPPLPAAAFVGRSVDAVLEQLAVRFINSSRGVRVKDGQVKVSQLFNWFAQDFVEAAGSVPRYLARYHKKYAKRLRSTKRLEFLPYDWSLNKQ